MRRLMLPVLLALATSLGVSPALACTGSRLADDDHWRMQEADAVFTGTVVGRSVPFGIGGSAVDWTFVVDEVRKGSVGTRVTVQTDIPEHCGGGFGLGERWEVYADADGLLGGLSVAYGNINARPTLEDPPPLDETGTGPSSVILPIAFGAALLVGAVVVIGPRRRRSDAARA